MHHHYSGSMTIRAVTLTFSLGIGDAGEGGFARRWWGHMTVPALPKAILLHVCASETLSENISFVSYCSRGGVGACNYPIKGIWNNF